MNQKHSSLGRQQVKEEAEHTQCSQRDFGRLGNDNREQKRRTETHVLDSTVVRHFPVIPSFSSQRAQPVQRAVSSKRNYLGKATIPSPTPFPGDTTLLKKRGAHISIRGSCEYKKGRGIWFG